MKRTIAAILLTFLVTLGLVGLALVAVARTGAVDVAVAGDDPPGVEWFFETLSENAIHRRAAAAVASGAITVPELTDAMRASGAAHYGPMCEVCHGGPGCRPGRSARACGPSLPTSPTRRKSSPRRRSSGC